MLAYVRRYLEEQEIEYAYLDGQTRDRGEVVERFQTDPGCNVFLVSLKAGGTIFEPGLVGSQNRCSEDEVTGFYEGDNLGHTTGQLV